MKGNEDILVFVFVFRPRTAICALGVRIVFWVERRERKRKTRVVVMTKSRVMEREPISQPPASLTSWQLPALMTATSLHIFMYRVRRTLGSPTHYFRATITTKDIFLIIIVQR